MTEPRAVCAATLRWHLPDTGAYPRGALRGATLLLLCWLAPALATAQHAGADHPPPAADEKALAAVVQALELRRFELLAAADYDAVAALLADDLVYTHSNGRVDTKDAYLAPLRAGTTRYVELVPSGLTVRVHGPTAIITGRVQMLATVSGEERRNDLRFTDVWLLRDGRWQLAAWHATRVP